MSAPPKNPNGPIRIVTAAALFDGHDAAINLMRRLIQDAGCEVIHLGHNRSVSDIVDAAIQEDVHAVAITSYQGGHMEFFTYLRELLNERGASHIRIFGGGGGVIVPEEAEALHAAGINRIYHPEDGRRMGLEGMIADLLSQCDVDLLAQDLPVLEDVVAGNVVAVARAISLAEAEVEKPGTLPEELKSELHEQAMNSTAPIVGITGTGGAGKSSFTDELVLRIRADHPDLKLVVLSVDPTRKRTGGALLGDRIRMNAVYGEGCFMRSLATRASGTELTASIHNALAVVKAAGAELILLETSGIGQGNSAVMEVSDLAIYVMTPEYGAPSQLEKIDMLDYADLVVLNKFERRGAEDAFRDVRKQVRRNRKIFSGPDEALPVFGTSAAHFNDAGVNAAYLHLLDCLANHSEKTWGSRLSVPESRATGRAEAVIPAKRVRYLGDIAETIRSYHDRSEKLAESARRAQQLLAAAEELDGEPADILRQKSSVYRSELSDSDRSILDDWEADAQRYRGQEFVYTVRGREIRQPLYTESLSKLQIPRVVFPRYRDDGERLRWARRENVPGRFPFTAGVFPLKRISELPKRMFAGEGGPARTNHRFHLLCEGEPVHRLSTAFDSVTLYGEDPHERPDIYGKIGESGVSVPHLDDMKILYGGFDLCAKTTSVSMTINGPAPILLAMFMNTAIDQQVEQFETQNGRIPNAEEALKIRQQAISVVRGTVQADILKEDQAQNTCIFSTGFALKMMADIQEYFIEQKVKNYYSVSISGYHIAEAGANPISQLAFTLANGFTYVENYLARGMDIDDFAPNLSFFFSNGLDPEYTVIGRVARRIWSVTMRERYGASERSQKLKYHIQTSGRSLHAREIQFNDVRTTLQALLALQDNCNSLHTNAYDEAITTPTEESVRRAMAIQLILAKEFGLLKNENALQGSFVVEELTDLVEEAVLQEFDRIDQRGGVLGAMETQYQRGQIQEESLYYEHLKHSGELPIIGINTFEDPETLGEDWTPPTVELRRASPAEKDAQIASVRKFQESHKDESPEALDRLEQVALEGGNIFAELMNTVRVATLGQITTRLYRVGGRYRRNL
ncbi:MAG: fused isobutyryl-CoA mutase/GTPase IcmF [Myxococcota bacterium]|nr:fused isobutyryl-CoA mutase/GTPase IcmF [Myxococcota bacterium]